MEMGFMRLDFVEICPNATAWQEQGMSERSVFVRCTESARARNLSLRHQRVWPTSELSKRKPSDGYAESDPA